MDLRMRLFREGKKQVHVARELGINPSRFCGILHGWAKPTQEQAERIAEYVGANPRRMFPNVPWVETRGRK